MCRMQSTGRGGRCFFKSQVLKVHQHDFCFLFPRAILRFGHLGDSLGIALTLQSALPSFQIWTLLRIRNWLPLFMRLLLILTTLSICDWRFAVEIVRSLGHGPQFGTCSSSVAYAYDQYHT